MVYRYTKNLNYGEINKLDRLVMADWKAKFNMINENYKQMIDNILDKRN